MARGAARRGGSIAGCDSRGTRGLRAGRPAPCCASLASRRVLRWRCWYKPAREHNDDWARAVTGDTEAFPEHERGCENQAKVKDLAENLTRLEACELAEAELVEESFHGGFVKLVVELAVACWQGEDRVFRRGYSVSY